MQKFDAAHSCILCSKTTRGKELLLIFTIVFNNICHIGLLPSRQKSLLYVSPLNAKYSVTDITTEIWPTKLHHVFSA